jgi:hypothetical protein
MDKKCCNCDYWIAIDLFNGRCERDGSNGVIRNANNGKECDGFKPKKAPETI